MSKQRHNMTTDELLSIGMALRGDRNAMEQSKDRVLGYSHAQSENDLIGTAEGFHGETADATRILPKVYDTPPVDGAIIAREAIGIVKDMLGTEAENYAVADVWWSNNACFDGETKGIYDEWGYLIRLTPAFSGAQMVFLYHSAYEDSDDYSRGWQYDRIEAWVASDGTLLALCWTAPLKVTETLSENTPLLPIEEIQSIFEQQINRVFAEERYRDAAITVDRVQLGLFRIREQNDMDHGLLVPVWYFTGVLMYGEEWAAERKKDGFREWDRSYYDNREPLLIINAIDGSIIDPTLGY